VRPAVLALAASGLAALGCTSGGGSCPGIPVAAFQFEGTRVPLGDPALADCEAPVTYPAAVAFSGTLSEEAGTGAAALCRSNGTVYSGERTGPSSYRVEASSGGAAPCSACAATLRVVVAGDVVPGAGGGPPTFSGSVTEVLTERGGACDGCLPPVPESDPPARACGARYALTGRTL
jgi:hypothetical protein